MFKQKAHASICFLTSVLYTFYRFLSMSPERFDHLLGLVSPLITKEDTNYRKAISAAERLALTLQFLATGESQVSLSFLFRLGKSTISKFIAETCKALRQVLFPLYVKPPSSTYARNVRKLQF